MTDAKKPRARRADGRATRARIIRAATRMFAASGFEATSLRQIAGAAEIDLATLKYHFGDKTALYSDVYRTGHEAFVEMMAPFLLQVARLEARAELEDAVRTLVRRIHDFAATHQTFIRMVLFRFLEESSEEIATEAELQGAAISGIEAAFKSLSDRGITRPSDIRASITMIISAFSSWFVVTQVRPGWVGEPLLSTPAGRARSEAVFEDLLLRLLIGSQDVDEVSAG